MKNRILFSLVVAVIPFFSFAQIDDMYFVPQKETKEQKEQQTRSQPSMHAISEYAATTAANGHVQNNARRLSIHQTNSSFQHPNYRCCGQQSFILGLTLWSQFHILGCI